MRNCVPAQPSPAPGCALPHPVALTLLACLMACAQEPTPHPTGLGPPVEPKPQGHLTFADDPLHFSDEFKSVPVLGDCNGDGRLDLYLSEHGRLLQQDAHGEFQLLRTFEPHAPTGQDLQTTALGSWHNFPNAALADMDGDGHLDLLVAGTAMDLYSGLGDCKFAAAQPLPKPCAAGTPAHVGTRDVDADGLLDLVIGCDGLPDPPYRFLLARGDGTFEAQTPTPASLIGKSKGLPVFASHFDDVDGDGVLDGFFLVDNNMGWFSWGTAAETPAFHRDNELAHAVADRDGMGVSTLDVDRDGRADYFLSGTPASDILLWNKGPREVHDIHAFAGLGTHAGLTAWTPFALDVDFDGWTDLLVLAVRDPSAADQRAPPWLHMSRHDATFRNVASQVLAADTSTFALTMACGDLARDGHIACFLDNMGGHIARLRNEIEPVGRWVGVRLQGTVSAPNAHGARVFLEGVKPPQMAVVGGQTATFANHDDGVLLAAGQAGTVTLRIEWPSGLVQRVPDVPTNTYATVTEPRVVQVKQRVVQADGLAQVEVRIDLQAAGTTAVTVEREGSGTWLGPLAPGPDGALVRTLLAPAKPGLARVIVKLQGAALRIRPRVRFE